MNILNVFFPSSVASKHLKVIYTPCDNGVPGDADKIRKYEGFRFYHFSCVVNVFQSLYGFILTHNWKAYYSVWCTVE